MFVILILIFGCKSTTNISFPQEGTKRKDSYLEVTIADIERDEKMKFNLH